MERTLAAVAGSNSLIISVNQVVVPYPVYPLGAACIIGALEGSGHQTRHFDMLADGGLQALEPLLSSARYDFIGLSIRNIDTVDSASPDNYLNGAVAIAKLIRRLQKTFIVIGGPAVSIIPQLLLDLLEADYAVVGEGEEVMTWLAGEIGKKQPPSKKILKFSAIEELIPCSRFMPHIAEYYTRHGGMLNVQTKRGCPYGCSYCSYPTIEGKKIRHYQPEQVVEEVKKLIRDFGGRYIFFTDSVFNDPDDRYLEIAEELIRQEVSIPWCAFFRPQGIGRSEIRLLKRAGLAAAELGTDAATDETLAGIKKGFSFKDVLAAHKIITAEDVSCAHFIMFGGPEENSSTLARGLANIELLKKSVVFAFIGIRILPGTDIHQRAIEDGIIARDQSLLEPTFYYSPQLSRAEMESSILTSFRRDMTRVYPCHKMNLRIASSHKMGFVGPSWDLLLQQGRRR
ncbi:lipid biosynthesis B12-binding/radical SAM protein [Desulfotalea psychrophila]|uniref:Related to methyltransferase n=1 Tax=Desulfotalea psychrophila (strain LSv54 / DSM 12343) TaxID=177439 RepID=Q6AM43_DESPS|nr:lipid biosynthesis B12-binding/radical SAM protein [Desulfotalea psychrophila]CAG36582.1 related to methyltransferase [Desulfotalea psychrophila LSv54]